MSTTTSIDAVGASFIDRTPRWLKELAISWFGEHDKIALRVGILLILAVAAVALGISSRTSPKPVIAGIVASTVVGALSIVERPGGSSSAVVALVTGSSLGSAAAILSWRGTLSLHLRRSIPSTSRVPLGWDRRAFLRTASTVAAVSAVASALALHSESRRTRRITARRPTSLPRVTLEEQTPVAASSVDGDVPFITPNDDFYRIDTALSFPNVDLEDWSLRVHGLVDREVRLSYDDLLALPQIERTITMCCVSNEVGGPYIGNAVWQGIPLAHVLTITGVSSNAEQVFSTSLDGWTCGFPIETALDGRDAMIAIGMNGEPLPLRHGFPARLVVPGLYGYVSATKWLADIEINRWSDRRGYWIPRGWSRLGPIKTQSRIDVPRRDQVIEPGPFRLAGVAWAQHIGIDAVEVRIDDAPWKTAELSDDLSDDTWRMWTLDWIATSGKHTIQVRATDKTGAVQTETVTPVAPNGATGWHTRRVTVRE